MPEHELWITALFNDHLAGVGNAFLSMVGFETAARPWANFGTLPFLGPLENKPAVTLAQMVARGVNAPLASSAGRLFDAIAAALSLCFDEIRFEGQAAMELQSLAEAAPDETGKYPTEPGPEIRWNGLWNGILADLKSGVSSRCIAARAHNTIAETICETVAQISTPDPGSPVVLAGGVLQNRLLLEQVTAELNARGHTVLSPKTFPANDGGLSLGQATIAAAKALREHATDLGGD